MTDITRVFNTETRALTNVQRRYVGQECDANATVLHIEYSVDFMKAAEPGTRWSAHIIFDVPDDDGDPQVYSFDGYRFVLNWNITSRLTKSRRVEYQLWYAKLEVSEDPETHIEILNAVEYILSEKDSIVLKPSIIATPPAFSPSVEPSIIGWIELWKATGIVAPVTQSQDEDGKTVITFATYDGARTFDITVNAAPLDANDKVPVGFLPTGSTAGTIPLIVGEIGDGRSLVYSHALGGFVDGSSVTPEGNRTWAELEAMAAAYDPDPSSPDYIPLGTIYNCSTAGRYRGVEYAPGTNWIWEVAISSTPGVAPSGHWEPLTGGTELITSWGDNDSNASSYVAASSLLTKQTIDGVATDLGTHIADASNPHAVTKAQVGLGSVVNAPMDATPTDDSANYVTSGGVYDAIGVVQGDIDAHEARTDNPHGVTKAQVGLGNADNTSDLNKPISTATQAALDGKLDKVVTTTDRSRAYTVDAEGVQTMTGLSQSADGLNLVQRQVSGQITVPTTPAADTDAASKAFVNSSIGTSTANFLGTYAALEDAQNPDSLGFTQAQVDTMKDPYSSASAQLATALATLLASQSVTPSANDYTFIEMDFTDPATSPDEYRRYKYDGTAWVYEYTLNNSSFTQAQWNAINSGIDTTKVASYDAHLASTSNPHAVTKAQVGLGNVDNYGSVSAWQGTPDNTHIPTEKLVKDAIDTLQTDVDGRVAGPGSSTDGHVAVFDGATGKAVRDSGLTLGASIPAITQSQDEGKALIVNQAGTGFTFGEAGKVDDVQVGGVSVVSNKIANVPAQVNADWNAVSGVAQILNRPAVDSAPTQSSTGLVTSGGVYTALDAKQDALTFDSTPTANSVNPVTSGGIYSALAAKQDTLTFDNAPTTGSSNPVTSDGIKTAMDDLPSFSITDNGTYSTMSWNSTKIQLVDQTTYYSIVFRGDRMTNTFDLYSKSQVDALLQSIVNSNIIDVTVGISAGTGNLQNITVTATAQGAATLSGTTDSAGKVRLNGAVTGATYTVTGSKEGYTVSSQTVMVAHLVNAVSLGAYRNGALRVTQTPVSGAVTITGGSYTGSNPYYLEPGTEYTVSVAQVSGYVQPADQMVTLTYGQDAELTFTHVAYPTAEVVQTGATGTVSCSPSPFAVSGNIYTLLPSTSYTFSVSQAVGYLKPADQTVSYSAGTENTVTFAHLTLPVLTVTVVDPDANTVTVSATNGTDTVTQSVAATAVGTSASLTVNDIGSYTISIPSPPTGGAATTVTATAVGGATVNAGTITVSYGSAGFTFGMTFDATTFQTDPTSCLAYTDDCLGYTPVSGPGSSLAKCSTIGSWEMKSDGTSDNPLLDECFYATFNSSGVLDEKLNPQNLTQKIATWNNTTKEWESASGTSSITSENTMFCIPTCYVGATASKIILSGSESDGTAFAHTIDGHTYDYLAIGVYEGYDDGTKLWSKSGVAASGSITRPTFRSHAQANTVQDGHAMVWNFHQWNLWRIMTILAMKSFNGQSQIGQGGFYYNGSTGQGLCNAMGPFAGSTSTSESTSTSVKAYIENPWGYKYEFIDDFVNEYVNGANRIWIGQNANPTDTPAAQGGTVTDKTSYPFALASSDFPSEIYTDAAVWGLGKATGGSSSTGLCDRQYTGASGPYIGRVGGYSGGVSDGNSGPSCLGANVTLYNSDVTWGARLAFVFDLE